MNKVNIGIIGAGSNDVLRVIKKAIESGNYVVINQPIPNIGCEKPVAKEYKCSGTFVATEEIKKSLDRLYEEQEKANREFEEVSQSAKKFKQTQFEKPRSKYHK